MANIQMLQSEVKKAMNQLKQAKKQVELLVKNPAWVAEARSYAKVQGREVKKFLAGDVQKVKQFLKREQNELKKFQTQMKGEAKRFENLVRKQAQELERIIRNAGAPKMPAKKIQTKKKVQRKKATASR